MIFYEYYKGPFNVFIFHIIKKISKKVFIKKLKLKSNSYGFSLFARIYDCFFSGMIDLQKEYRKYHCREYDTFNEFLQKKYNLSKKIASQGEKLLKKYNNTSLFLRKEHVNGDYTLEQFIFSKEGPIITILSNILGVQIEN